MTARGPSGRPKGWSRSWSAGAAAVLGAAIVGAHAGELILPWVLAVEQRLKLRAMAGLVVPYPTLGEVSKRAAGAYYAPRLFGAARPLAGAPPGQARMSRARRPGAGCRCWRSWRLALAVYASGLHRELSLADPASPARGAAGLRRGASARGTAGVRPRLCGGNGPVAAGRAVPDLTAGFLFGTWLGGALVRLGATAGAVAVFLIARTAVGSALRDRAGPWLHRMEAGFRADAFSYLLVLRLVPLFPFWLVNLVPAFLGVPLRDLRARDLPGDHPGRRSSSPASGNGLGAVLDHGGQPDLGLILEPRVLAPLLGLAALALLPVALPALAPAGRLSSGRRVAAFGSAGWPMRRNLSRRLRLSSAPGKAEQRAELLLDRVADGGDRRGAAAMGATQRLRDDLVDQPVAEQVLGRQLQGLGRGRRLVVAAPEDGGAAFGRDHRVDRVLEDQDPIGGGQARWRRPSRPRRRSWRPAAPRATGRPRSRGRSPPPGRAPRHRCRDGRRACRRRSAPAGGSARPAASAGPPCGSPRAAPCRNCGARGPRCRRPSRGR